MESKKDPVQRLEPDPARRKNHQNAAVVGLAIIATAAVLAAILYIAIIIWAGTGGSVPGK